MVVAGFTVVGTKFEGAGVIVGAEISGKLGEYLLEVLVGAIVGKFAVGDTGAVNTGGVETGIPIGAKGGSLVVVAGKVEVPREGTVGGNADVVGLVVPEIEGTPEIDGEDIVGRVR